MEAAHKEAEKAREEEEQRRLQDEAERVRRDAEEHRVEQERWEKEEVEAARRRRSCKESELTPLAAPETELPKSNREGARVGPRVGGRTGVAEMRLRDAECVHLKVRGIQLGI